MKIVYFACIDRSSFPGVEKKLIQTVRTLFELGHFARLDLIDGGMLERYTRLFARLWQADADVVIIRNLLGLGFCMPALLRLRLRKTRVVIDVPSPIFSTVLEVWSSQGSLWRRAGKVIMHRLLFPLSLLPATKILQYEVDSPWFKFGVNRKTQVIGNGIDTSSVPLRSGEPPWPSDELVLIGVATISTWHGFDRILRGIAQSNSKQRVRVILIGEGEAKIALQKLAGTLGISTLVEFRGFQSGKALDECFETAHIGISSLGLFRNGLAGASTLKSREYCARGIPFVTAGRDVDFAPTPPFVHVIPNSDVPVNIDLLVDWFTTLRNSGISPSGIRQYAIEKLDFRNKLSAILEDYR